MPLEMGTGGTSIEGHECRLFQMNDEVQTRRLSRRIQTTMRIEAGDVQIHK